MVSLEKVAFNVFEDILTYSDLVNSIKIYEQEGFAELAVRRKYDTLLHKIKQYFSQERKERKKQIKELSSLFHETANNLYAKNSEHSTSKKLEEFVRECKEDEELQSFNNLQITEKSTDDIMEEFKLSRWDYDKLCNKISICNYYKLIQDLKLS